LIIANKALRETLGQFRKLLSQTWKRLDEKADFRLSYVITIDQVSEGPVPRSKIRKTFVHGGNGPSLAGTRLLIEPFEATAFI
jgi:hypothetical protein